MRRIVVLAGAVLVLCSASAAQAQAPSAPDLRRGLVRVEFGPVTTIHETRGSGDVSAAVRVARVWRDDHIRLEAGILRGSADGGFTATDVGMEVRGCPSTCRVVPFLAVGLGGINDRIGAAPMSRLSVGVDLKLSEDRLLRFGLLRSTHGKGFAGPNSLTIGFAQRFGARRH